MGDSYRDYVKGHKRARNRVRQEVDRQAAVDARASAIRERNRRKAAEAGQKEMRLDGRSS